MTDLTEQWKKGKIPESWYYVKDIHNKESLDRYFKETDNFEYLEDWEVGEVLAPVPTYEECQASYNCILENEVLRLKNAQLKELLKECRKYIEPHIKEGFVDFEVDDIRNCLTKIDEALR